MQQCEQVGEARIYGSRAKSNYKPGSDVDIALKGANLGLKTIAHINYLLNEETLMPHEFDVLNFQTLKNKELADHIERVGIVFYQVSD